MQKNIFHFRTRAEVRVKRIIYFSDVYNSVFAKFGGEQVLLCFCIDAFLVEEGQAGGSFGTPDPKERMSLLCSFLFAHWRELFPRIRTVRIVSWREREEFRSPDQSSRAGVARGSSSSGSTQSERGHRQHRHVLPQRSEKIP